MRKLIVIPSPLIVRDFMAAGAFSEIDDDETYYLSGPLPGLDQPIEELMANGARYLEEVPFDRERKRAAAVVTASEHAKREIGDVYGIAPEGIHVVPLGVDAAFSPGPVPDEVLARLGVRRPFVLTVGTLQPRKNLEGALSAFELLVARGADLTLVVAGGAGWAARATAQRIERSPAAGRVVLTGHVGDHELLALYRAAECFVFPSRYEGFGLPVLEAMASGTPVVCSDRTSLPEVAGGAALLVSPDEPEDIAAAIARVTDSPALREQLIAGGLAQARRFSWERCADETVAVYRAVLGSR